jgi:hypothetical protein
MKQLVCLAVLVMGLVLGGCASPKRMSIDLPAVRIQETVEPAPVFQDLERGKTGT